MSRTAYIYIYTKICTEYTAHHYYSNISVWSVRILRFKSCIHVNAFEKPNHIARAVARFVSNVQNQAWIYMNLLRPIQQRGDSLEVMKALHWQYRSAPTKYSTGFENSETMSSRCVNRDVSFIELFRESLYGDPFSYCRDLSKIYRFLWAGMATARSFLAECLIASASAADWISSNAIASSKTSKISVAMAKAYHQYKIGVM